MLCTPDKPSPIKTIAGGSVTNTIRGLRVGFGVSCGLICAYGDDQQGQLFVSNMTFSGVNLSRLRMKKGPTGQVIFLFMLMNFISLFLVFLLDHYVCFVWLRAEISSCATVCLSG